MGRGRGQQPRDRVESVFLRALHRVSVVISQFALGIPMTAVSLKSSRPPFPSQQQGAPGSLLRPPLGGILLVQHLDHVHQAVVAGLVDVTVPADLLRQLRPKEAQQHAIQESRVVVGGGCVCGPCTASDYLGLVSVESRPPDRVSFGNRTEAHSRGAGA